MNSRPWYIIFIPFVFAGLCGFFILTYATSRGVVVDSVDSTIYVETAQSILSGNGFQHYGKPLTHYPPAYPLLLALSGLFGMTPLEAARWLQIMIFVLNTLLVGTITYELTRRSIQASLCSMLLFLTAPVMLMVHVMVRSESPFILFTLLSFLFMALYIRKSSLWWLAASSVCVALALMTRYVGITLLPPMIAAILFFGRKPFRAGVRNSILFLIPAVLSLGLWLIRGTLVAQSATNRPIVFHPIDITQIKSLVHTLYDFWFPFSCQLHWKIPLLLLASGFVLFLFLRKVEDDLERKKAPEPGTIVEATIVCFFFVYVLFVFFSISFLDAATPLDFRIMSPFYAMGLIFLASLFWGIRNLRGGRHIWHFFLLFAVALLCVHSSRMVSPVRGLHNEGAGYTSAAWTNSETISYVKSLPRGKTVYSNGPDVIRFLAEMNALSVPYRTSPYSLEKNPAFGKELEAMGADIVRNDTVVIYFDAFAWRSYMAAREDLSGIPGMKVLFRFKDGTVYGVIPLRHQ